MTERLSLQPGGDGFSDARVSVAKPTVHLGKTTKTLAEDKTSTVSLTVGDSPKGKDFSP